MGEYASYKGNEIKIGTCENLYYLRADQVRRLDDPTVVTAYLDAYRFRFPFPDEDSNEPGEIGHRAHDRGVAVHGDVAQVLARLDPEQHFSVQLTSPLGYVLSIPCPESSGTPGLVAAEGIITTTDGRENPYHVGRNGFAGSLFVRQQRYWEGRLVTVVGCACGAVWRLETLEQAEPVIVALRAQADALQRASDRHPDGPSGPDGQAVFLHVIADRIAEGYVTTPVLV